MLNKLNIKKDYILIAASIILLILAYQTAFKNTIDAWRLHHSLEQQVQQAATLSYQPGYLERKNHNLDKIFNVFKADTAAFRSNELNQISSIAERQNVKLSEVPTEDPVYHSNHAMIQKLAFEGDYFDLVKTLHDLSSAPGIGFIRSVKLGSVRKTGTKDNNRKTMMQVYFELDGR